MKLATQARRALLVSMLAGTTALSSGCSTAGFSLASMNPFAKPSPTPTSGGFGATESIAGTTKKGVSAIAASAKSAVGKTTDVMTGVFRSQERSIAEGVENDPLSLSNKPKKIDAEVFVANGQLWESTGDMTKAMESYTKALEVEPTNAPALTSMARLNYRQGKYSQSVEFYRQALAQSPSEANLHYELGLALSKMGDKAGAVVSLEQALKLSPKTSRYANSLATVKFEAKDSNGAYQVLTTNNKPAVAHFNMAYLYFNNGQMGDAKDQLSQALAFEAQSQADPTIKRAVDRSRQMLAQIEASMKPVAQAAPQATIAGGQFFRESGSAAAVRQASQATQAQPASTRAPATSSPSTAAPVPTAPATYRRPAPAQQDIQRPANSPSYTLPLPAQPDLTDSALSGNSNAASVASRPMPVRPTPANAAAGVGVNGPSTSAADSSKWIPQPADAAEEKQESSFTLPAGFEMP